tara:strand:- start:871 stop:1800 length:930 start_codon:yes stop_codon:yes gene_type:complete
MFSNKLFTKIGLVILLILVIFLSTFFIVDQRYVAFVKTLGKINTENGDNPKIYAPGLQFKVPAITQVVLFDTRLRTLTSEPQKVPTKEQKFVFVDYFVKWKIKDYKQYYLVTNNYTYKTEELLKPRVSDALKGEFGQKTIAQVISQDREQIMLNVLKSLQSKASSLGIDVFDMRIKRIDLPKEVQDSVYSRMRTKREAVANEHRAEGRKLAMKIRSNTDREVVEIVSGAKSNAKKIRGTADAKAAEIYANSYSQDPEFYQFFKSMQSYEKIFNSNENLLLLSPDSDFFKYFNKQNIELSANKKSENNKN